MRRRVDGRLGLVPIEQAIGLETDAGHEDAARALVATAEDGCPVAVSLYLPVETSINAYTAVETPARP